MNPVALPLAASYGMARSSVTSGGSLINLYPQLTPAGARGPVALIGAPGTALFANLTYSFEDAELDETLIHAAIEAWDGQVVVVGEHAIYLVQSDATWARLANTGMAGPVSIAWNGIDVAAVNGTEGYWITETTVDPIDDAAFYPSNSVTFLNGYFIFNRADTGQAFMTRAYSRLFDGLDFAEAEKAPDNLVGVMACGDDLFLFGVRTVEVWYDAQNLQFAFARTPGATMGYGCASFASVAVYDRSICWLTSDGLVVSAAGLAPQRISDDQVERALKERKADWAAARAFIYPDEGHVFYVLTVGDLTLVCDLASGDWHERRNYSRGHCLARCYVNAWGKHIVGDDTGRLLEMSSEIADDAGEPLVAEIVSMPYVNSRLFSALGSLEIEVDTGEFAPGLDYYVGLSATRDGGRTWTPERLAPVGPSGAYGRRVEWRKLGAKREHRFRIRITDPIRRRFLAQAHMRMG